MHSTTQFVYISGSSDDLKVQISRRILSIIGVVATICSMALWAYYIYRNEFDENNERMGLLIVSVMAPLLISVVWWENFVSKVKVNFHN